MPPNNIDLPLCKFILLQSISQRYSRMIKPMQFMRVFFIRYMPVIQKVIMKQSPSDQLSFTARNMQLLAEPYTVSCHIHHMRIHCHISMLNIRLHLIEIPGSQNIRSFRPDLTLNCLIIFQFALPSPGLFLITAFKNSFCHLAYFSCSLQTEGFFSFPFNYSNYITFCHKKIAQKGLKYTSLHYLFFFFRFFSDYIQL